MTDEESMLIDAARDFARGELLERDRTWDAGEGSLAEVLPQLAEMGFMNLCIPEKLGGLGCTYQVYSEILQELAYASPSVAVALSVHNMVGMMVQRFGAEPKLTEWLSRWGQADSFAAFAISEAGAGSDLSAAQTEAKPVEGGYRVTGEKMWISNGMRARWFLTLVRTDPSAGKAGLSAMVIDGTEQGLSRDETKGKLGLRGSDMAVIHFEDVFVPSGHLLGAEGQGMKVCLSALNRGRIGIAAQAAGISRACLDEMVSYAQKREQFGQRIAEFQAIQHMVADTDVELAASRALIRAAAEAADAGDLGAAAAARAKLFATEAANRIAYRAIQVHGGSGYVREFRVEQLFRDARATTIYEGTSEIQRLVIARELLRDAQP